MQKTEEKRIAKEQNKNQVIGNKKKINGITLVALVVTIVVLLILAGITITYVMGDNSIFNKAKQAREETNIAKAREKLELVLLTDARVEKHTNPKYNQEDFLDELILKKIQGAEIIDDIAIVDNYAFSIDRSVPKIGEYLGKKEDLIFPELEISNPILAQDRKTASFTITAREKENGISKIEILQEGHVIETYEYDNRKKEIQEQYVAKQNGNYVVRVYSKLTIKKVVEVIGIIPVIDFTPNGNEEYQKEHSTKITIQEMADKVVSIKYQWTNSTVEPEESSFNDKEMCKSGDTIIKNELTGTYYLWTMLETQSGENLKWRSEGFNFDNQGPNITTFTSTAVSYSSFKLNITAIDQQSGIVEYEFFVGGVSKGKKTTDGIKTSDTQEITITNAEYGNNNCYVMVKDKVGNITRKDITAKTLMDTTGPTISSFSATKYSETGITLSATAQDTGTGVTKFEFYIDNVLKGTQTCTATTSNVTKSKTITGISTGSHTCMVKVYDAKNNSNRSSKSGTTKLYAWEKWDWTSNNRYRIVKDESWDRTYKNSGYTGSDSESGLYTEYSFNAATGFFSRSWNKENRVWLFDSREL